MYFSLPVSQPTQLIGSSSAGAREGAASAVASEVGTAGAMSVAVSSEGGTAGTMSATVSSDDGTARAMSAAISAEGDGGRDVGGGLLRKSGPQGRCRQRRQRERAGVL